MAPPPPPSLGIDFPAVIVTNCSIISGPRAGIQLATEADESGTWTCHVLKSWRGRREILLSETAFSLEDAFAGLHLKSAKAVHHFLASHGADFPREVKVRREHVEYDDSDHWDSESLGGERVGDGESEGESDDEPTDEVSIISLANSLARPCNFKTDNNQIRSAGKAGKTSPPMPGRGCGYNKTPSLPTRPITPPPPPTVSCPSFIPTFKTGLPKVVRPQSCKRTEMVACLTISRPEHDNIKILTRVEPSLSALRAKAIDIMRQRTGKDDEDASLTPLHATVQSVRIGDGEELELEGFGDDVTDLFTDHIPRFYINVSGA